uniref:hypothetical protein n=1 Tax=Neorhizobium sp. EC2-8 TaxID=3129230 RepID=UPI0031013F95
MDEIIQHFGIDVPTHAAVPTETVEGIQGLIVFRKDGLRVLKSIPWGPPPQPTAHNHVSTVRGSGVIAGHFRGSLKRR